MSTKAVLFDLDGTLLDTLDDLADSVNAVLAEAGLPTHPVDSYRQFVGEGAALLVTRALPQHMRTSSDVQKFLALFRAEYDRCWKTKTRPYEGIPELLDGLTSRGLKIAVLSNKPDDFAKKCVEHFLPSHGFAAVFGQQDGVARKPDPAGALVIAQSLHLGPHDILYAGDSSIDMLTASRAGMYPMGVLWGFRSRDELVAHGAKSLVERPVEILAFIEREPIIAAPEPVVRHAR
jgi:phosphoglycolate phosphatase